MATKKNDKIKVKLPRNTVMLLVKPKTGSKKKAKNSSKPAAKQAARFLQTKDNEGQPRF